MRIVNSNGEGQEDSGIKIINSDGTRSGSSGSSGDMTKAVYDTDNDGVVDDSEKLGGSLPSVYAAETTQTIGDLINSATSKSTPVDADYVGLMDSAASNILKKLSWANIKATAKSYFDSIYQPLDSDLTTIAGLTATTDNFIQSKSSAWASRTIAQVKTDLGIKRGSIFCQTNVFAPADATTYFFGGIGVQEPNTVAGTRRIYFPIACTIDSCIIFCYNASAGSTENVSAYIRLNNTTDYTISTTYQMTASATYSICSNTSMSVPIAANDFIELKLVCPTWATNPGNSYLHAIFTWTE